MEWKNIPVKKSEKEKRVICVVRGCSNKGSSGPCGINYCLPSKFCFQNYS